MTTVNERFYDICCKNKEEKKLLGSLMRTKAGPFIRRLYEQMDEEWKDDYCDFTVIVQRVGYYIGNWYEYYELGETEDAGIRLPHIRTIEKWMKKSERYCDYVGYKLEKPYY